MTTPTAAIPVSRPADERASASRRRRAWSTTQVIALRVARTLGILLVVSMAVFALSLLLPGDPAVTLAGEGATPEEIERIRETLGLNRPWFEQYGTWLLNAVQGDLGQSLYLNTPVNELIAARLPVTLSLALVAIVIATVFGVLAGMLAAAKRGRWADKIITIFSTVGIAAPNFWIGMILLILFAFTWRIFPAIGYTPLSQDPGEWIRHLILPGIALAFAIGAELQRQTRSSMSEVLSQDFVRTARAQGMSRPAVLWQRVLKNGAPPVVTTIGFQIAVLLGGSVVIEKVFTLPGLGTLAIEAVLTKDLPALQGVVLINAIFVVLINLLTDLAYVALNPKVRAS